MTKEQINKINILRASGCDSKEISNKLGISYDAVRSFIRRHPDISIEGGCKYCGAELIQLPGKRTKSFCNTRCKNAYWNSKRLTLAPIHKCENCGKEFRSYESEKRKYCSQRCYRAFRYSG